MKLHFRYTVTPCFIHGENVLEIQRVVKTIFCGITNSGEKQENNTTTQVYFNFTQCLLFNLQISVFLQ